MVVSGTPSDTIEFYRAPPAGPSTAGRQSFRWAGHDGAAAMASPRACFLRPAAGRRGSRRGFLESPQTCLGPRNACELSMNNNRFGLIALVAVLSFTAIGLAQTAKEDIKGAGQDVKE